MFDLRANGADGWEPQLSYERPIGAMPGIEGLSVPGMVQACDYRMSPPSIPEAITA
jgi:hypothetical protein